MISLDLFALRRAKMAKLFYRLFSISLPFPYTQTISFGEENI